MDIRDFVVDLLDKNPAVGYPQIDDLICIGNTLCNDFFSPQDVIKIFVEHMQQYYGVST